MRVQPARLWAYGLFAAVLSGAGLPIYIYAPTYFAETYGVSLGTLGALLFGLRLLDVVQDPALGWISERLNKGRGIVVALAGGLLAASMLGLFAVTPPVAPAFWFALTLAGLFTAFSFLTISFYGLGVGKAQRLSGGHVRLAAWRESGALLGVCAGAIAPTVLAYVVAGPFVAFAIGFAALTLLAVIAMAPEWRMAAAPQPPVGIRVILGDPLARRLLLLALVNATPLAVTSTLFLFYVAEVLQAPGLEGPFLLVFFLAAAASAPVWSRAATRFRAKPVLLSAMGLAVVTFGAAVTLGPGQTAAFAVICILSGATIGADLTLLPAMFARRMAVVAPNGGQGFGLWTLVSKLTLAVAAVVLLPILEVMGLNVGDAPSTPQAVRGLVLFYAVLPCVLKLLAIALLARVDVGGERDQTD